MFSFHITIHARPVEAAPAAVVTLAGRDWPTLAVPPAALATPFAVSFEQAAGNLARLPRMFIELDGSFVWVSAADEASWQVDGVLYDRNGRLLFVDLKGACPASRFDELLAAVGWPETQIIFQLVREAVFLDEATFRAYAGEQH